MNFIQLVFQHLCHIFLWAVAKAIVSIIIGGVVDANMHIAHCSIPFELIIDCIQFLCQALQLTLTTLHTQLNFLHFSFQSYHSVFSFHCGQNIACEFSAQIHNRAIKCF